MSQRLRFNTARDLFDAFPEAAEDISAEPGDQPSMDYLNALLDSPTPENAVTFCAYLLPRREAVWWGHQCLHRIPDAMEPSDFAMLDLAEDWVREPDEERRQAALGAALQTKPSTPAVWIAFAAGWSGGSMLDASDPAVPPPAHLTAKAVNAGILSLLARVDQSQRAATLRAFVEMGIQLLSYE
jgi:hypothetical protein